MTLRSNFLAALAAALLAPGANAQVADPPPFPEFSFRRIGVPGPDHVGPRINIQIGPQQAAAPASAPEAPPVAPAPGAAQWFWDALAAGGNTGAARFQAAMTLLDTDPQSAALGHARLDLLRRLAADHGRAILRATVETRVSPALVLAVMAVESSGRTDVVSSAGAVGLMQLIPATATRFGVENSLDGAQNIAGGAAYLNWLMDRFDRDPILVLAAYNAGEGAVEAAGGVPDYAETRAYVPRVLASWQVARLLCLTPPELVSDGCVFHTLLSEG